MILNNRLIVFYFIMIFAILQHFSFIFINLIDKIFYILFT